MLALFSLGRLELFEAETPVFPARRKELVLLAYLAARAPRAVPREELATLLWGERGEARARQSLRQALSELRQAVGVGLETGPDKVRLTEGTVQFDVRRFEAAVAADRLAEAVALWQGDFLAGAEEAGGEEFRAWMEQERAGLRQRLAWAFEQLVDRAQASGEPERASGYAHQWSEALPYDEAAQRRLLELLRLSGRGAEAAARYSRFAARLQTELGTVPSPELRRLGAAPTPRPEAGRLGLRGLLTPDLVGRAEPLLQLEQAWQRVRQGAAEVVLFVGEEGLGKSRLAAEFVRTVQRRSEPAAVIESRAFEAEREIPWAALRSLLAGLADAPGLRAAPPSALAAAADIAPKIRERLPQLPAAGPREQWAGAVVRVLAEVAAETSLLLSLDDVGAADVQSLEVVRELIRRPPPGLFLLLAVRPGQLAALQLPHGAGAANPHVLWIELRPLDLREVELLVASMLPLAPETSRPLAERLEHDAAGVPGQVERLVRAWAEAGVLRLGPDGSWRLRAPLGSEPLPVVSGIRESVAARLQQLPETARAVVAAASLELEPALLERISGVRGDAYVAAIGELLSQRILRESQSRPGSYEFASDAVRRAVYDGLAPSRRHVLHRAAAAALRRLPAATPYRQERIRHHAERGGPRRLPPWAIATGLGAILLAGWAVLGRHGKPVATGTQVLLADVTTASGDSTLGLIISTAATVALSGSRYIALFPRARVRETLARMGHPRDTVLSEQLAREIALREGIAAVVVLGAARVEDEYVLSAHFFDPASGRDVHAAVRRVHGRGSLLNGLDDLLRETRRALGESGTQLREHPEPLPRVTTASLDALLAYAEGADAWNRRNYYRAEERWLRAVELDSNFALALAGLANNAWINHNDRVESRALMHRALGQVGRLTERERLRIEAQVAQREGNAEGAVELMRGIAERYPSRDTWFDLATTLLGEYRCREAIPAARRALGYDSGFANGHINLATCLQLTGQLEQSLAEYAAAGRADSSALLRGNVNHEWGVAFVRAGRPAAAESAYRRMQLGDDLNDRARGHRSLGWLMLYEGRARAAVAELTEAVSLTERAKARLSEYRNRVILAEAYLTLGDTALARRQLDSAGSLGKTLRLDPVFQLYFGHAALRAGRRDQARQALEQLIAEGPPINDLDRNAKAGLEGSIRLARGDAAGALAVTRPENGERVVTFRLAALAEAYLDRQQPDSALAVAIRLSNTFSFGEEAQLEWQRSPLLVAKASETLGDSSTARAAYSRFIEQWKQGDRDLPDLVLARRALARLQAFVPR